jgi:hypothetical protein
MQAAESRAGRRWPRAVSSAGAFVGVVAALGIGPLGCAGHHHISEAPPHPIAVEVHNNLTIPTELTVYITQDQGGVRTMLGTVPGDQTKTFNYTPISWGQSYRFIAERQLERPVSSPVFTIADPETGAISWNVVPNQVQFYETEVDTTAHPAAGSH